MGSPSKGGSEYGDGAGAAEGSPPAWEGPLDAAIMFVDLVDSSVFASVTGLKEYSDFVESFHKVVRVQCEYFFEHYLKGKYERGRDYDYSVIGDELVFFMHTSKPSNDVYLLATLGIALKAAWIASPFNRERIECRSAAAEIAVGINFGTVWARELETGYKRQGYAINLAKRIESHSRDGQHFRIFLSDAAYNLLHTRMRNLLFSDGEFASGKGILGQFGVYEIVDAFVDSVERLAPEISGLFEELIGAAIDSTSRNLWIHSAYQVASEKRNGVVTEEAADRCRRVLNYQPENAVALYYLAQFYREQGKLELAEISYLQLLSSWPHFGHGHFECAKCLIEMGKEKEARTTFLRAERLGIEEATRWLAQGSGSDPAAGPDQ